MSDEFVPPEFAVPTVFMGDGFRLEPLGPQHNERDYDAWMSSVGFIRSLPGFGASWPVEMSLEQNLSDLVGHARDFGDRSGFTYSILDSNEVIGCMYLYPSRELDHDADMKWWVMESRAEMASTVGPTLRTWIETEWPFKNPAL